MKVEKKVQVSVDKLFDVVTASLKNDYEQNTSQPLFDDNIQPGLTYLKSFGRNQQHQVKVLLTAFEKPRLYEVVFSSNRGKQTVSYCFSSLSKDESTITYQQKVSEADFFQKANNFLLNKLFKKSIERQIDAQLNALANQAKNSSIK